MAEECGGCYVEIDNVPLKYAGLQNWETWISEAQERMTLSVPKEKWEEFNDLMKRRGVEATIVGEFNDSGRCVVESEGQIIMDIDMDFLHDGLPKIPIKTEFNLVNHEEPDIPILEDYTETLNKMMARLNIASFEFISQQYDHEVQGGSALKPLQGRGKINADATVTRPVLSSDKGVVVSQGMNPTYSHIDTYHMAACSIDTAIRNAVVSGGNLDHMAMLDNFCWCSSDDPIRLGQLKKAVEACHDYALAFEEAFGSGKDSMFNDFKGYDEDGNKIKISVPPTLLVTTVSVMDDAAKSVSLDAKFEDDLVYVLGDTYDELGGSEYFAMFGEETQGMKYIGNNVPKVDAEKNLGLYKAYSSCLDEEILESAISVRDAGLGVALAKTAIAGGLGLDVSLENLPGEASRGDFALFSQSQGRIVVTISPDYKDRFEELMQGHSYAGIGTVTAKEKGIKIKGLEGKTIVDSGTQTVLESHKSRFKGY